MRFLLKMRSDAGPVQCLNIASSTSKIGISLNTIVTVLQPAKVLSNELTSELSSQTCLQTDVHLCPFISWNKNT